MKRGTLRLEDFKLESDTATPIYLQLQSFIEEAIRLGTLRGGDALPSERRLAKALSISRMTVRHAIDGIVEKSLVKRVLGSGTYVLHSRVHQPITRLQGFSEEAKALGFKPGSVIIEIAYVAATSRASSALTVTVGDQVLRITRLRTANGIPLAIQVAHISPRLARFPVEDFQACGSLYGVISKHYNVWPHHAFQTVGARLPTTKERKLLEVSPFAPVLSLERITYDESGFPFLRLGRNMGKMRECSIQGAEGRFMSVSTTFLHGYARNVEKHISRKRRLMLSRTSSGPWMSNQVSWRARREIYAVAVNVEQAHPADAKKRRG